MRRRQWLLVSLAVAFLPVITVAVWLSSGSGSAASVQPKIAIDMVKDGDSWCNPVDSTASHDPGQTYQVAICLLDSTVPASDFNIELLYDSNLNSCSSVNQTGAGLDANPDFIGDAALPGSNWLCGPTAYPRCGNGVAYITCLTGTSLGTISGPWPIALVNFTAVAGGVDNLRLGDAGLYYETQNYQIELLNCPRDGPSRCLGASDVKTGPTLTPTDVNAPTATPTPTRTPMATAVNTPIGGARIAIDMVKDGDKWCDPVDSSASHEVGLGDYQVAICLLDGVVASDFNIELLYNKDLNSCSNVNQSGLGLDANPDFIGDLTNPSPTWECAGGGFAYPRCGNGAAFITCGNVDDPGALSGPWPIALVTFHAVAGGVDTLSFGTTALYNHQGYSVVKCPDDGPSRCLGATDAKSTPVPPPVTPLPSATPHTGVGGTVLLPPAAVVGASETMAGDSRHSAAVWLAFAGALVAMAMMGGWCVRSRPRT